MQTWHNAVIRLNSELAVTDHDKADILNAQFTSIFTVDDGILPQVETRTQSQLSDINLSPEVIRKLLCKLPNKFSRSPDGIPSPVLRSLSFELCTPLYYLFRQSLDTGTCPSLWKSADITPIYKKGDASLASNYRPIYTTKIGGVVCPPNTSETVAVRTVKLAHRPRIASKTIKFISKPILLSSL